MKNEVDPTCGPTQLARRALFAFVLTFIAARTMVLLIMSQRIPNLYFFLHGTHVHHLNYGIFLLAAVGAWLLLRAPRGREARLAALAYGIAMALTFDEFGMWLHLGGSYWQRTAHARGAAHPCVRRAHRRAARIRGGAARCIAAHWATRGPAPRGAGTRLIALVKTNTAPFLRAPCSGLGPAKRGPSVNVPLAG
jgi:hypothetical protein